MSLSHLKKDILLSDLLIHEKSGRSSVPVFFNKVASSSLHQVFNRSNLADTDVFCIVEEEEKERNDRWV